MGTGITSAVASPFQQARRGVSKYFSNNCQDNELDCREAATLYSCKGLLFCLERRTGCGKVEHRELEQLRSALTGTGKPKTFCNRTHLDIAMAGSPKPSNEDQPLPPGFQTIEQLQNSPSDQIKGGKMVNVIGFAKDYQPPFKSKGSGMELNLRDPQIS